MAKRLVFDSGPIISLTTNNLLFLLSEFKKRGDFEFLITPAVRKELIDKPFSTKKFKFEALQVYECVKNGKIAVHESEKMKETTMNLLTLANSIYSAQDSLISIVHYGEMEAIAAAMELSADAMIIDERTTRVLLENPARLREILERKLHTAVTMDAEKLERFKNTTGDIKVIRSCEFVTVAYELGMLERFLPESKSGSDVVESVLWGVKLNGCAITEQEIAEVMKIESQNKEG